MDVRAARTKRDALPSASDLRDERSATRTKRDAEPPAENARHERSGWRVCSALAAGQCGVVTRAQLLGAGVHSSQIKRWTANSSLHRLHCGVYAVGHLALAPRATEQAALLACGRGATLSHASAAYLWGLLDAPPVAVEVTLVGRHIRSKTGISIHRTDRLDERDRRRKHGLALTSPARTALDLAAHLNLDRLEALVAEGRVRNLIRDGELEGALARAGQTTGASRLRAFLDSEEEPAITRSWGERTLRRLFREARIPQPKFNRSIRGWEIDLLWESEKLVVEFDGFRFHGHRRAFERDRRKDVALAELDYEVLRFTARQLKYEPLAVIASIARALERRRQASTAAAGPRH